jgi:hypothetical protein
MIRHTQSADNGTSTQSAGNGKDAQAMVNQQLMRHPPSNAQMKLTEKRMKRRTKHIAKRKERCEAEADETTQSEKHKKQAMQMALIR